MSMENEFITLDINNQSAFKKIIALAKRDGKFKACGNPDHPWIILKFKDKEAFSEWIDGAE